MSVIQATQFYAQIFKQTGLNAVLFLVSITLENCYFQLQATFLLLEST